MTRTRRLAVRLAPVAVSGMALWALLAVIEPAALAAALSWRIVALLGPALLVYGAVSLALESASLLRLVRPDSNGFGVASAARIKCASYLLGIVHYGLGAGALSVLLRRRAGVSLAQAASVVGLVAWLDFLVILGLATLAALAASEPGTLRAGVLAGAGIAALACLVLLRAPPSVGPLERIRSLALFESLRSVSMLRLGEVALLRLLFQVSFLALSACAFRAFGLAPSPAELVVGMLGVVVIAALPLAVAGIGTSHAAFVYAFQDLADPATLLATALTLSVGVIALRVGLGLVFAPEYTRLALESRAAGREASGSDLETRSQVRSDP